MQNKKDISKKKTIKKEEKIEISSTK